MHIRRPAQEATPRTVMQGGPHGVCALGSRALNHRAYFQRGGPQVGVQLPAGVDDGVHLLRTLLRHPAPQDVCSPLLKSISVRQQLHRTWELTANLHSAGSAVSRVHGPLRCSSAAHAEQRHTGRLAEPSPASLFPELSCPYTEDMCLSPCPSALPRRNQPSSSNDRPAQQSIHTKAGGSLQRGLQLREGHLSGLSCLKCGLSPVTISQSTTPRLQMSAFSLHSCPANTCKQQP